jgi:hypothetical protein
MYSISLINTPNLCVHRISTFNCSVQYVSTLHKIIISFTALNQKNYGKLTAKDKFHEFELLSLYLCSWYLRLKGTES